MTQTIMQKMDYEREVIKIMRIYDVRRDWETEKYRIVSTEAKETPKGYSIKKQTADFDFSSRLSKDEVHLTPLAAIEARLKERNYILSQEENNVKMVKNNITQLKNLRIVLIDGDGLGAK